MVGVSGPPPPYRVTGTYNQRRFWFFWDWILDEETKQAMRDRHELDRTTLPAAIQRYWPEVWRWVSA